MHQYNRGSKALYFDTLHTLTVSQFAAYCVTFLCKNELVVVKEGWETFGQVTLHLPIMHTPYQHKRALQTLMKSACLLLSLNECSYKHPYKPYTHLIPFTLHNHVWIVYVCLQQMCNYAAVLSSCACTIFAFESGFAQITGPE